MAISDKLTQIANNVPLVYDAGYQKGKAEGGGDSWYDTFWDGYQDNGNRNNYRQAFMQSGWNDTTFKPKYNLVCNDCYQMFSNSRITDLEQLLIENGVTIDTSNSQYFTQLIQSSTITHLPKIDLSNAVNTSYAFAVGTIKVIRELVVSETTPFSNTFASMIEHMIVTGTIGQNGFFLSAPNLSRESIVSIVNALSSTTTNLSITLSLTAVNKAFETSAGANDGSTSAEWIALDNSKSNWTISLV